MQTSSNISEQDKKPVIICVDDELTLLRTLSLQLGNAFGKDYDIETVDTASSALIRVSELNSIGVDIPVIICDQSMPTMLGDDFLIQIHKSNPETRKIMLTGIASIEDLGKALNNANLYRYISKPWDSGNLIFTVTEAIRSFYTNKALALKKVELEKSFFYNRDTKLANWEKLQERFEELRLIGQKFTIAILKIENFAYLLEFFGEKIYKKILVALIDLMKTRIISLDEEVFHTKQDEFVILSTKATNEEFVHKFTLFRLILKSEYLVVEGIPFQISLYISITNGSNNLYSAAKSGLLHRQNNSGSTNILEHTNEIEFHKQNIYWGQKLNIAIENKSIVPYYQGIMDNRTGKISKYECLVRMEENGKVISPDKFLNLASAMGIMKLITIIVMDKAFSKFSNNLDTLSINLTQFDLEYRDLPDLIDAKLKHYNIEPSRVTFEILENISLNANSQSLHTLNALKEIGCKISIDDFGVHYSNLARLLEIQPDFIKIDGWFIQNLLKNNKAYLVTKSIIDLSHSLNAEVIAEFVSDEKIQKILLEMNVEYSQGFYFSKPSANLLN